jgi:UDP-glucose:(heptosyl)LPS alpha-1,3-glucosyltransferase
MKIALVTGQVNNFAGVHRYVSSLAGVLARSHEVTIFSETFEGLEGTPVGHQPVRRSGSAISMQDVSRLLNEEYDIVHAHHYKYPLTSDVITSHYCEREGLERMALAARRNPYGDPPPHLESVAKAAIESKVLERNSASPLIVLSRQMKSEFISHYGVPSEQIFVVPSGVDSDAYCPQNAALVRNEVRQRYDVGPNQPLVLLVGGDWERKGVGQAIKALSRAVSYGAKLMVVGPGDVESYRRLATDLGIGNSVIFPGNRNYAWKYYAASDVFLLPTLYEAFGLVILEAMASGLPVLTSRTAGAAELVSDGVDGLLINDPRDVAEISAKLVALLSDEGRRRYLGLAARHSALHYSWDRVARKTVEVYDRVLQHKRLSRQGAPALSAQQSWRERSALA